MATNEYSTYPTVFTRYEMGNNRDGVIEFYKSRYPAIDDAREAATKTGRTHYVFDRMARRGWPELWAVYPRQLSPSLICRATRTRPQEDD